MGNANAAEEEKGGGLKLRGFAGGHHEAAPGRSLPGSQQCTVIHRPAVGASLPPSAESHGHSWSPAWLAESPWLACPVVMTQAFHLQNGRDGSCRLPTHAWGQKPPAVPQTHQRQILKVRTCFSRQCNCCFHC